MSADMEKDIFADTVYGRIALTKLYPVTDNFRLYYAGWLGDAGEVMEMRGAEFRRAKSGKNKGTLSILVKGTDRKTFVTAEEMER